MRSILSLFLTSLVLLLASCEQEPESIPTAEFETDFWASYDHVQNLDDVPRFLSFEPVQFVDKSVNGVKYSWDFGDGQTSDEPEPVVRFERGGVYNVTLTVQSETGNTAVSSKQVRIYDRVIKKISVLVQTWNHNLSDFGWPQDKVADIVLEIGVLKPGDHLIPSTILYTSDVIEDVTPGPQVISIFPRERLQVDYNLLPSLEEPRPGYVFLLYAIDQSGRHLFYSSEHGPGLNYYLDAQTGRYRLKSGVAIENELAFE